MYNFSNLAIELNEMEPNVAPTDSRLRPDQRLMEETHFDKADEKKLYLEQKQRNRLKMFDREPEPIWFEKQFDPYTKEERYVYKNEYWGCKARQDWRKCPDLF